MLKTILSQVKEFKRVSILTPVFVLGEVILEMVIPLLMASIIDEGVTAGNIDHIKNHRPLDAAAGGGQPVPGAAQRPVWRPGLSGSGPEPSAGHV